MTLTEGILLVTAVIILWYTLETRSLRVQQANEFRSERAAFFDFELVTNTNIGGPLTLHARNTSNNSAYHPALVWYDITQRKFFLSGSAPNVIPGQQTERFQFEQPPISRSETRCRLWARYPLLQHRVWNFDPEVNSPLEPEGNSFAAMYFLTDRGDLFLVRADLDANSNSFEPSPATRWRIESSLRWLVT
jgi:hypothetical protein